MIDFIVLILFILNIINARTENFNFIFEI